MTENDLTAKSPAEDAVIRCDQFVAHPPADVWRALTEPELHERWWTAGDVRPVVGHRFTLDMGGYGQQPCEVIRVVPGELIAYTFAEGSLDSTLTWRVVPEGKGSRLFLEHAGLDLDSPLGRQAYEGMGRGWPKLLRRISVAFEDAGA